MYLFANSPSTRQPTTAIGRCFVWCIRTPNAFVRRHSILILHKTVTCFWLHAQVYRCFCCISEYNRKKQSVYSTTGELLVDKMVRTFYFALLRLGNFTTSDCLVGRLTCAPATTGTGCTTFCYCRAHYFYLYEVQPPMSWSLVYEIA